MANVPPPWQTVETKMRTSSSKTGCLPTLDLHGYCRTEAVRRITDFLEKHRSGTCSLPSTSTTSQGSKTTTTTSNTTTTNAATSTANDCSTLTTASTHPSWVCIITGSGSHSQHGPVLRNAALELFTKRQMVFTMSKGRGSFIVDANSGIILQRRMSVDTKVLVKKTMEDTMDENEDNEWTTKRSTAEASPFSSWLSKHVQHELEQVSSLSSSSPEKMLSQILAESRRQYQKHHRIRGEELQLWNAALKESANMHNRQTLQSHQEEQVLQEALIQSRIDQEIQEKTFEQEMEKLMQQFLMTSANEYHYKQEQEDCDLEQVLEKSAVDYHETVQQLECLQMEEEKMLREVLERSKSETLLIPKESLLDEEEEFHQVLLQSKDEAHWDGSRIIPGSESHMSEDELLNHILEQSLFDQ